MLDAQRPQAARRWRRWPPSCPASGHRVLPADLAEPGAAERLAAEAGRDRRSSSPTPGCPAPARLDELQRRGGQARPAGQPRGADAARPRPLPGDARARLGPPRLRRLALRQGGQPPLLRSTTRPSSACAASPSACAPTSTRTGSASRIVSRASSAKPGCSPTPAPSPRRGWAPPRPEQVGDAVVKAIEREQGRDRGRAAPAALRSPTSPWSAPASQRPRPERQRRPEGGRGHRRRALLGQALSSGWHPRPADTHGGQLGRLRRGMPAPLPR